MFLPYNFSHNKMQTEALKKQLRTIASVLIFDDCLDKDDDEDIEEEFSVSKRKQKTSIINIDMPIEACMEIYSAFNVEQAFNLLVLESN